MHRFLVELKRRRVVRAALVYTGAAFVVLQAADLFVEALQLPPVVLATVGIAAIVGLPVALVLAWAFDIEPADGSGSSAAGQPESAWISLKSGIAVVALIAFGVLLGRVPGFFTPHEATPADTTIRRYEITLPEHAPVEFIGASPLAVPTVPLAITPDGNRLVYVGSAPDGDTQLYVRDLGAFDVRPLPGSEGAYAPFVSPDGQWVGFFSNDQLRVVSIEGGKPRVLVETPNPGGGAWWGADRIIYNDREARTQWWIPAAGGTPMRLFPGRLDSPSGQEDATDGRPVLMGDEFQPLPDGERFLVYVAPDRVAAYRPATGELTTVLNLGVNVRVASDTLIYAVANDIFAVDFDAGTATVSGPERLVGSELRRDGELAQFVASDRTLIYATGAPFRRAELVLAGPDGVADDMDVAADRYRQAAFSPDGRRLAVAVVGTQSDVWIVDLQRGERRRLTRGGVNVGPHWSADGQYIYFSSDRDSASNVFSVYRTRADAGPGEAELVLSTGQSLIIDTLQRDHLATVNQRGETGMKVTIADLETGELRAVPPPPGASEVLSSVSPDGQWVALTSDASGRYEVYLHPLGPNGGHRVQISTSGGEEPRWAPDMSRLYYRYGRTLYSVSLNFDNGRPVAGPAEQVFEDGRWQNVLGYSYWPAPVEGRFLILRADQPPTTRSLRVVEGWRGPGDPPR